MAWIAVIFSLSECRQIVFSVAIQAHGRLYSCQDISIPMESKNIPDKTLLHLLVAIVGIVWAISTLVQNGKY